MADHEKRKDKNIIKLLRKNLNKEITPRRKVDSPALLTSDQVHNMAGGV